MTPSAINKHEKNLYHRKLTKYSYSLQFVPDEDLRGWNIVLLQSTVLLEMLDITTGMIKKLEHRLASQGHVGIPDKDHKAAHLLGKISHPVSHPHMINAMTYSLM